MQYKMLAEYGIRKDIEFKETQQLKKEGLKVVYQGVEGAYAHEAALCCFGENADAYHVPSWRDAMEEVKSGKAEYAVLPIENSTAGSVTQVYDLLYCRRSISESRTCADRTFWRKNFRYSKGLFTPSGVNAE